MPDILPHLNRNLAQAEALGQKERVKKLKARIAELETVEDDEEFLEEEE